MLLTVKLVWIALTCGAIALVCILAWTWSGDPQSLGPVHVGRGLKLPTYASGPVSHAWWATIILLLVASSLYLSFVFSYIYLWTVAPQVWPMAGQGMPLATWALGVAVLLGVSASCVYTADRMLGRSRAGFAALLLAALVALSAASAVEIIGHWNSGLRPDASAYAALVYLAALLQLQAVAAVVVIGMFTRARLAAGRLDSTRRVTFDSLALLAYYSAGQGLLGALLVHGFPRAMA